MGRAAGAPDRVEAAQGGVDDRSHRAFVAERRDAADREPRRLAHLVASGLADAGAELVGVDAAVAGAEAEDRRRPSSTKTRDFTICPTSTPTASAASCAVRVESASSLDLDLEAQFVRPILKRAEPSDAAMT